MYSVSIVIPARNDAAALGSAVASVERQTDVAVCDIVIAVGPSYDATKEVAEELAATNPLIRIVENPSGTTPDALNLAIAAAEGEVLVRVDARSVLPAHYVANALETMQQTGAANVGAVQLPVGTTRTQRAIAAAMRSPLGSGGAKYRHSRRAVQVETAYLGVFRRTALDAVGGFDERFIRNQDSELNIRLRNEGYEIWLDPRLVVDYAARSSFSRLASQYWQYGWWRARTVRKHPRSVKLRQLIPPLALAASGLASVLAVLISPTFLVIPAVYLAAILLAAALAPGATSLAERPRTALALLTMHASWGAAFLVSLVLGKRAGRR